MAIRSRYKNVSIEENLNEWVKPLVEQKTLGFKSYAEFITQAIREKIERYIEFGIHPWSRFKKEKESEKASKIQPALLILAVLSLSIFAATIASKSGITGNFIDPLSPFRANIPEIYEQYSYMIDFLVFTAVFVSIAYITIGRQFGHKGIAIAIGTVLALALSAMEPVWGFNLKSFGPLAAGVFILVLGSFIYGLIRHLNIDRLGAIAGAIVLIYLGMSLYTTSFISWFMARLPVLPLIVFVALLIMLYKVATRIFGKGIATTALEPEIFSSAEIKEYYPKMKEQEQIIKKYLSKITKKAQKQSSQIVAEVVYVIDMVTKFGSSPEGKRLIALKIKEISPQEHTLRETLSYLKATVQQIRNFDLRLFQQFKDKYLRLGPMEQRKVKEEVQEEMEKINAEQKLTEFESEWDTYDESFRNCLSNAMLKLNEGNIDETKKHLKEAMDYEVKTVEILDRMRGFEDLLYELTKKEMKMLQRK
jgi:hypothetical protein